VIAGIAGIHLLIKARYTTDPIQTLGIMIAVCMFICVMITVLGVMYILETNGADNKNDRRRCERQRS
jgi:choline-glycine betaine transporter